MRRLKALLPASLAVLALAVLVVYLAGWNGRRHAVRYASAVAPNGLYRVEKYTLGTADGAVMLRVLDPQGHLLGEYVKHHYQGHPLLQDQWVCTADACSLYWWNSGDDDRIALPPSRLDRLRALIP